MMEDMFFPHELPLDDELQARYRMTATAALAAHDALMRPRGEVFKRLLEAAKKAVNQIDTTCVQQEFFNDIHSFCACA